MAATTGLALSASLSKFGRAQIAEGDLPPAGDALTQTMPAPAPVLDFTNERGKTMSLADYAGHGLVVNVWATWCMPCVAEIPSFAAIAPGLARDKILILPISIDIDGADAVVPFFAKHRITTLPVLLDTSGDALNTLDTPGIPVTIIVNPAGKVVAKLVGTANWNTPGTIALIRKLAGPPPQGGGIMPV